MIFLMKTDGKGLVIELTINWKSLRAFIKAVLLVATTLITLLATPEIHRIGVLLGLW